MATFNNDLDISIQSIDQKLSDIELRLSKIDQKFNSLGNKFNILISVAIFILVNVSLQYFEKSSIPCFSDQSTNLLNKFDSKPNHDGNVDKMIQLNQNGLRVSDDDASKRELVHIEKTDDVIFPAATTKRGCTQNLTTDQTITKTKKSINASEVLKLLSSFIKVNDRKTYIDHYNLVTKFFLNELKKDETFKRLFNGEVMAGSYRDRLKIVKPNEFDTILRLSFGDQSNMIVKKIDDKPAYCTIKLINYELIIKAKPYLQQFLDSEGYILQDEIIIWIHNLLQRILKPYDENNKTIIIENNEYQYKHSRNGPAFTFKFTVCNTDIKFDIDLVPAIPFDFTHWISTRNYSQDNNQINWSAVPKPPKNGVQRKNRSFICSYTQMEQSLLYNTNQAKNLIRIFKKLRDKQNLNDLKSYYIKTIFLWKFDNTTAKERKAFCKQSLSVMFVDMIKVIWDHIHKRELIFYWDSTYNMFSNIAETKLKAWDEILGGIISRLENLIKVNPKGLIDLILTPQEKTHFECTYKLQLCPD